MAYKEHLEKWNAQKSLNEEVLSKAWVRAQLQNPHFDRSAASKSPSWECSLSDLKSHMPYLFL